MRKAATGAVARDDGESPRPGSPLRGFNFDDGIAGVAYWVLPGGPAGAAAVATCAVMALSAWAA